MPCKAAHKRQDVSIYTDTFLPGASTSVEQFLQRIRVSGQATQRYAEYLHMPPTRVLDALSAGLKLDSLKAAGSFTEYRHHSNGVIYPVRVELARGTRIVKGINGKVSLLASNGDPIIPFAVVVNVINTPASPPRKAPPTDVVITAPEREIVQGTQRAPADGQRPKQQAPPATP